MAALNEPGLTAGLLPRLALAGLLLLPGALKSQAASFHLSATDASGASSFNASLHFTNDATGAAAAPAAGNDYAVSTAPGLVLRTPSANGNYTFAGGSLTLSNAGTMFIKSGSPTIITVNNLTNSGMVTTAQGVNCFATLAGTMAVVGVGGLYTGSTPASDNRTLTNATTMSGSGALTNYGGGFIIFTGNNTAFTGPVRVGPANLGNNGPTTLEVSSQSNLGGTPAAFNAAQLLLDNGIFQALASFSLNNANSGITLNPGGGNFNVGSGITLTIAEPVTGAGSLTKSSTGTLILTGANTYTNTFVTGGILNVQNSSGLGTNGTVNQAGSNRGGSIQLQGNVSLPSAVKFITSNDGSVAPFTNAIENISGNNTINGTISLTIGGGSTVIQSDSGALLLAGNITIASGQTSRGVLLQGASTAANMISGNISDLSPTSVNSVIKAGSGTWTLAGTNTYTGGTTISNGTLAVSGSGSISNTPVISIASGTTLDVSGLSTTFTLGAGQSISNSIGTVNGSMATAAGSSIYPATVGVAGTLTYNNNLNLSAGGTVYFDLSPSAASGNDQIAVGGNLTLSSTDYIHINAMSGVLDTVDYVLFSVSTDTTMSSTPVLVWDGSVPANYLNYSLLQVGNNVVLHFSASTAPSVTASINPTSAARNQAVTVTADVTQGSGSIVSVTVDLTQIGGSATTGLILDSVDSTPPTYIYTNTFLVSAGTALGNKSLTVTATDNSSPAPLTGTYIITPVAITANAADWDGDASDNKWTSNTNWTSDIGPGFIGDSVTFSGVTQLAPDMNTNYSVTSVTFDSTAGAFTLGSSTGSTLTSSGGITNNSGSTETLTVPVVVSAAQTFNAVSGNLTLNTNISLGGNTLTVDGTANTAIGGVISGTAGIAKNGSGTLVLSAANTYGNNGASDTSVNVGVLAIGNDLALGTSRLNIGDGGTVQSSDSSAHTISNNLNFGSGAGGNVIFAGTGNLKLTGSPNNGTDKTLTVNNPQTELSGVMSGASARTVAGTGVLILSRANTYSGNTTINPGATLQLGNGSTNGSLATSGAIDVEGTLIINRSNAVVQGVDFSASPITGGGSFTQAGSGTTTLNAANSYGGLTTVNNGELFITPAYQQGGNVIVTDGAKFGISASSVSNSATIGNLTLGSSAGGTTLDLSYGLTGNPTNAAFVAGAVNINGTSAVRIGGSFVPGTFPILKYSSLSGAFSSLVTGPRGVTATVSNDAVNQVIYVTVSSVGGGIVWTGTNSVSPNFWDLNTTTNWLIGGLPTVYLETVPPGDAVAFNDQGSGLVLVSNTVSPASVTISNSSVNYAFQGSGQINSAGGLTKVGAGTVTMNVPGTFSGSTVVSNGTLSIGANQTFANLSGNSAITLSSGTPTLTVNDSVNTTFVGTIAGATLTLTGGGQLTLTGSNSLSVNLFVSSGALSLTSGLMSLSGYASIGHTGTDNGILNLKGTASMTDTGDFNVGDVGASVGTFNIQDTATLTANAIYVGSANGTGSTASGTVNQTGGAVTALSTTVGNFSIGGRTTTTSVNGVGTYNLSGGTLTASSPIRVGAVGQGTFEQSNGLVIANAGVDIAAISGSSGTYYFDGGTLRTLNVTSSSAANSTLNLNGGVLIPLGNNTAFVTNVVQINVRNGGAVVDTTNFNVTISQALQHSVIGGDNAMDGGLTKRGNGTLTLTGFGSSYTGPTVVMGGVLNLAAGSVGNLNNLALNNTALGLGLNGGTTSFPAANVTLAGNSTLNFNYDLISGTPVAALTASGSLTASGTTTINVFGYGWTPGQFTLVSYTGTPLANLNNFALGALPYGVTASLSNNAANLSIDLVVTAVSIATWIPLTATDPVGTSGFNAPGTWQDGNPPTLGNGYITRTFALRSPADANAYSFGGSALSVDTGGRFIMKGTNGQVLTVNNLIMNGGLVDYANSSDSYTETLAGNIILQAGLTSYMGALSAGGSETLFETAPIGGSGNLQIGGSTVNNGSDTGAVVLAATNTYTGTTTVATGTLLVNGVNGSSAITVGTGATFGGTGSVGGTVTVQAGGTLAPGIPTKGALSNTIGTLTATGAASVSGGVVMKINRTGSPTSDEFVAPAITVNSGATLTVANIGSTNFAAGDTFTLFSAPISGPFSTVTLPALPGPNLYWTNNLSLNGSIAVVSVVTVNPNSTNIVATLNSGVLTLAWPQDHTGWTLQVQTNSSSVGLGTNWVDVPGSAATNAVTIPVNLTNDTVFYRLKL